MKSSWRKRSAIWSAPAQDNKEEDIGPHTRPNSEHSQPRRLKIWVLPPIQTHIDESCPLALNSHYFHSLLTVWPFTFPGQSILYLACKRNLTISFGLYESTADLLGSQSEIEHNHTLVYHAEFMGRNRHCLVPQG